MNHLKGMGTLVVVAIFAATLLGSAADAKPIIDKGALGKYERDGRFLHRVYAGSSRTMSPATVHADTNAANGVRYDKGALGTWMRDGRRVTRIYESDEKATTGTSQSKKRTFRTVDHIKHIHRFPADR